MSFFPRRVEKSLTWPQWQHNMHIAVLEVEFSSRSQEELFLLSLLDWRIYWRRRWRKAGKKRRRSNCQARWPSCNQFSDFFNFFVKTTTDSYRTYYVTKTIKLNTISSLRRLFCWTVYVVAPQGVWDYLGSTSMRTMWVWSTRSWRHWLSIVRLRCCAGQIY